MKSCNRCMPYLVFLAVRKCDHIGQRWSAGPEERRVALLIAPDQHPALRDLIRTHLVEMGLESVPASAWNHPSALQVDSATLSLDTPVQPVFAERLLTLHLHETPTKP